MRNSLLSGLDLTQESLLCMMLPEAMLMIVVHAPFPGQDEARDPCGCVLSVLLTEAVIISLGFVASGGQCEWPMKPLEAMLNLKGYE